MPERRVQEGDRVRIVGDHPHRGEAGTVLDPARDMGAAGVLVEVELDPGPGIGNVGGCFAAPHLVRPLPPDEDPR